MNRLIALITSLAVLTATLLTFGLTSQANATPKPVAPQTIRSAAPTTDTAAAGDGKTGSRADGHAAVSRISAGCSGGRCTVYLSKTETRNLGQGRVPPAPGFLPMPLKIAWYALLYAHRFIAAQYAARNWCSLFRLSIYPWEPQGYAGYAC